jgi:hypothetical protein
MPANDLDLLPLLIEIEKGKEEEEGFLAKQ